MNSTPVYIDVSPGDTNWRVLDMLSYLTSVRTYFTVKSLLLLPPHAPAYHGSLLYDSSQTPTCIVPRIALR